jgi:hypothetical protein
MLRRRSSALLLTYCFATFIRLSHAFLHAAAVFRAGLVICLKLSTKNAEKLLQNAQKFGILLPTSNDNAKERR